MPEHSNTVSNEELILSCVPWVEKMARRYSRDSHRVEYEELYSIGMVEACEAASHLERCTTNPLAYLCGAAKLAILDELRKVYRHNPTVSLFSDTSLSLLNVLSDHSSPINLPRNKRVYALNGALRRTSPRRRAVLRRIYGLEGYGRGDRTGKDVARQLGVTKGTMSGYWSRGLAALRRDARLCKVVGVEVMA
jgi:RNA polymerase sigma factor (sigma-70 family)